MANSTKTITVIHTETSRTYERRTVGASLTDRAAAKAKCRSTCTFCPASVVTVHATEAAPTGPFLIRTTCGREWGRR